MLALPVLAPSRLVGREQHVARVRQERGDLVPVAAGTIYATVKNNVKVYTASTEGDDLFGFYTDESGYIAINHSSELKSLAYDTVAYTGITFFAEYIDMVVKGTIAATA